MSKDKRYLVVQVVFPHILGARALVNVDYIVFRPEDLKINSVKISIKQKYRANNDYPFELT